MEDGLMKVTEYKGVDIKVDSDGWFYASHPAYKLAVRERAFTKVVKAIDDAEPVIELTHAYKHRYGGGSVGIARLSASDVRRMIVRSTNGFLEDYGLPSPALVEQVKEADAEYDAACRVAREKRDEKIKNLIDNMLLVPVETAETLLEAARLAKNARR